MIKVSDPTLKAAVFLDQHPGWSPDDLERADPDLVEQMRAITTAHARVAKQQREREG